MRRKVKFLFLVAIIIWFASLSISWVLFIILGVWGLLILVAGVSFLIANKLVKKTYWWKNQYLACKQFVSNSGYRDNIQRNYEIVNLGSNPARFAFFYENVKGQSWATGSQGQDMDFEILKYFHSYLKRGGTVLIPIMPFTAISTYLKEREDYWGTGYYSKFYQILDGHQASLLPNAKKIGRYLKFPLLYNRSAIRFLFKDCLQDNRYQISEQPMMNIELEEDAKKWINGWLKEFKLEKLNDCQSEKWVKYYKDAVKLTQSMVNYCLERDLRPVFICVPMSHYLSDLFPADLRKYLVTDFVKACNEHNIPFLDYTLDPDFQDASLYFDSFFLNMRGRKLFTRRVLKDLEIETDYSQQNVK